MPDPDFGQLRRDLRRAGILPAVIDRLAEELADHLDDIEAESRALGLGAPAARSEAIARLGAGGDIVARYASATILKRWSCRHPLAARALCPLALAAQWPLAAIDAAADCATVIARWSTCLFLAGLVTAALLLLMQLTISPI